MMRCHQRKRRSHIILRAHISNYQLEIHMGIMTNPGSRHLREIDSTAYLHIQRLSMSGLVALVVGSTFAGMIFRGRPSSLDSDPFGDLVLTLEAQRTAMFEDIERRRQLLCENKSRVKRCKANIRAPMARIPKSEPRTRKKMSCSDWI